ALNSVRRHPLALRAQDLPAARISFSQHGEDLLLLEHLVWMRRARRGISVDGGCYDPFEFSNTRLLHLHGWRGINVDAASDVIEKFQKFRPSDHNVCAALAGEPAEVELAGRPGSATRHLVPAGQGDKAGPRLRATTLEGILASSPFASEPVDLLDIDCENQDAAILRGFPFDRTRPAMICIEAHAAAELAEIQNFLAPLDYFRVGPRGPSHIFRDRRTVPPDASAHTRYAELS
ncbi:MAG: FkbM family methyltransferase, partial [Terrimicrobiaceae bacterium]|nr:FkbM family methyltransferase [Terrimicrobiaceae bacterium]